MYAALLGFDEQYALLQHEGKEFRVSLPWLGSLWTGDYTFLWQVPPGYQQAIGPGSQGEPVRWLARQFAVLDQQSAPLADEEYNDALMVRITFFQRQHGLRDDGVAGQQTLLKVNEVLGLARPFVQLPQSVTGSGGMR